MGSYALGLARRAARRGTHDRRVNWSALWDFRTGSLADVIGGVRPTVTRASTAWAFNAAGVLTAYPADVLRIVPSPAGVMSALVEATSTNLITNGEGVGAAGAAVPTGWQVQQQFGGLSPDSWVSGVDAKGCGYAQFRVNGVTTVANRCLLSYTGARVAVAAAVPVTFSSSLALVAGVGYDMQMVYLWYDAGGALLSQTVGAVRTPGAYARYAETVTPPANAVTCNARWDFVGYNGAVGTAVNFTLRLAAAQLEAMPFATSYIPTSGAAVTRAGDFIALPFAPGLSITEGTLFCSYEAYATVVAARTYAINLVDGGLARLALRASDPGEIYPKAVVGDGAVNTTFSVNNAFNADNKVALAYSSAGTTLARNGASAATPTAWAGGSSLPATVYVGCTVAPGGNQLNGYIRLFGTLRSRLSDAQLQALTAA